MNNLKFIIISIISLIYAFAANANNISTNSYLLKPSGSYGIGYQDMGIINNTICPDKLYKPGVNENDFSPNNLQHCHEIILRIYYPSTTSATIGDKYYLPTLAEENKWLINHHKLTESEATLLNTNQDLRTYTNIDAAPVQNKKFPVILFMPGSGQSVHTYNNIVSNLVSNGYIVVGINSTFANGPLLLSNGHMVARPENYDDAVRLENLDDLSFIINNLPTLPYKFDLNKSINFKKIGLLGHSMGAMNIVNFIKHSNLGKVKAMNIIALFKQGNYRNIRANILMDPGNILKEANYPLATSSLPTLVMWSSHFKSIMNSSALPGENNYWVNLGSIADGPRFSSHENFSDLSTYQYHPAYQIPKIHNVLTNSDYMGVGSGNGYEISAEINNYILQFFNLYIKRTSSKIFSHCKPASKHSQLTCIK